MLRYSHPNELVFTFEGSYVCANFGENRSRNTTVRVPTDGNRLTAENRFYNSVDLGLLIKAENDWWIIIIIIIIIIIFIKSCQDAAYTNQ